jgi:CubicO group peptidase (beta-lactamase class C family)
MYFGVAPDAEQRVATLRNAPVTEQSDIMSLTPSLVDVAGAFNRSEVRRASIPGAGAIVNARSVARHYAMMAAGGELDGVRLLSRERIAVAATLQPEDADRAGIRWWTGHGLGYTLGGGTGPMVGRPDAFGYEGVGTVGFADPSRRFAFAFLKNLLDLSEHEMDSATLVVRVVEEVLGIA